MLGYNKQRETQREARIRDLKKKLSPQAFAIELQKYKEEKAETKMACLELPSLSKSVFNIKFMPGKKQLILGTDFNKHFFVARLSHNNSLELLTQKELHSGRQHLTQT